MAGGICLPPKTVDAVKNALISGKINPDKLSKLTSEERHKLFSDIVGDGNAKYVNSMFESKMLLKNQQQGYLTWAKKLVGVTPEIRRDLITRINKMDDRILSPEEEKTFLKDLASTKLGMNVSVKEAKQIANMSSKLQEYAAKQRKDGTFPSEADRMAYGRAKVALGAHLAELKNASEKLSFKQQAMQHPFTTTSKVAGLAKSLKATLDDSAIFRQGWKTMFTNPISWQRNARKTFIDIARQLGNKEVLKEVQADIISRPNADAYAKMKLAIGNIEEEFPSTLPEKVPLFGRVYKASEAAYTGFLYRQRADIADYMLDVAKKSGVDITDKAQLESIGKLINSLTGRGNLGRLEGTAADTLNNVFFSARFLKSNIDLLTAHQLQKGVTPFVRKRAAINLVKVASGTAAILAVANAVKPGSVEMDPTSSDFGKIRIGDTRFDVTGGNSSILVLAAQIIRQQKKSAQTGVVTKFDGSYGAPTGTGQVWNFFENKFSPAASVVRDIVKQQDSNGNKPTVKGELGNLFIPLPATTVTNTKSDPSHANVLLTYIADSLGVASNTYGESKRNPENNITKTQQGFKDKVGQAKFTQANDDYNKQYSAWLAQSKSKLDSAPAEDRAGYISAAKTKIQNNIYKQYGYKPKNSKPSDSQKATKKSLLESIR